MNFLSHYFYNRYVRDCDAGPYFAMGVALPDIWPRFSRKRRIRWRSVEAARPARPEAQALRAGLLNHVEADRAFHALPLFLDWQRAVRRVVAPRGGDAVTDFLAHIAVELALDWWLLDEDDGLARSFYAALQLCAIDEVERHAGTLADADTSGLGEVVAGFVGRQFLIRYREPDGMTEAIRRVFMLTTVPTPPSVDVIRAGVAAAVEIARPTLLWDALRAT